MTATLGPRRQTTKSELAELYLGLDRRESRAIRTICEELGVTIVEFCAIAALHAVDELEGTRLAIRHRDRLHPRS